MTLPRQRHDVQLHGVLVTKEDRLAAIENLRRVVLKWPAWANPDAKKKSIRWGHEGGQRAVPGYTLVNVRLHCPFADRETEDETDTVSDFALD